LSCGEQFFEYDPCLHARQTGPQAEMRAAAESQKCGGVTVDVEAVGGGEFLRIAIGRRE
jgi:hypothetical protein